MIVSYRNRKGDIYYLHRTVTSRGKLRYYFAKYPKANPVYRVPDGYEIYEHPNGQVFLRKKGPNAFSRNQIIGIRKFCDRFLGPSNYILNIHGNTLVIYIATIRTEEQEGTLVIAVRHSRTEIDSFIPTDIYAPVFRLSQSMQRGRKKYTIEKYYEDELPKRWVVMESSIDLAALVKRYLQKYQRYLRSHSKFHYGENST